MALDLTSARELIADVVTTDTCVITSNPNTVAGEVLDPTTGKLVRRTANDTVVYTGPCGVKQMSESEQTIGERSRLVGSWVATLPWDAPEIKHGYELRVTAALEDQTLVNRRFKIISIGAGTILVSRQLGMDEVT